MPPTPPPTPPLPPALQINQGALDFPYQWYKVRTYYRTDPGTRPIPLAPSPTPVTAQNPSQEVVNVSQPRQIRVVRFDIARTGKLPDLPSAVSKYTGEVLIYQKVKVYETPPVVDGTVPFYRVRGCYKFTIPVPYTEAQGLPLPHSAIVSGDLPALPSQVWTGGKY